MKKERHTLTDAQWEKIKGMLPKRKRMGRPPRNDREIVNGILWVLKTGCPWRDLKESYGPWQTVYDRFSKWTKSGVWDKILSKLQAGFHSKGKIDWRLFSIDGSSIRAHKSAGGAKRSKKRGKKASALSKGREDQALGYSRGGFGTKAHLICDRKGLPLRVGLSAGQRHESRYFECLAGDVSIRGKPGRPRRYPEKYAGDKAYASGRIRGWLRVRGIEDVIPWKRNSRAVISFNKRVYKGRNVIERCIGWLKESRRIATRYDKLSSHYLGMIKLGMILRYL